MPAIPPPFAVELTVPGLPASAGTPVPVSIQVRNLQAQPLWMVGVLDGSEVGFRYPHYLPTITGPAPPAPPEELAWCGNVAPLRPQDFRLLQPGESFDPTARVDDIAWLPLQTFLQFRPAAPGRYELRLTVSTESERAEDWLGLLENPGRARALELLRLVPRTRIVSNVAVVNVR